MYATVSKVATRTRKREGSWSPIRANMKGGNIITRLTPSVKSTAACSSKIAGIHLLILHKYKNKQITNEGVLSLTSIFFPTRIPPPFVLAS
jgi:hypothetical protein